MNLPWFVLVSWFKQGCSEHCMLSPHTDLPQLLYSDTCNTVHVCDACVPVRVHDLPASSKTPTTILKNPFVRRDRTPLTRTNLAPKKNYSDPILTLWSCTGATIHTTAGLFMNMKPRAGASLDRTISARSSIDGGANGHHTSSSSSSGGGCPHMAAAAPAASSEQRVPVGADSKL